jgi:hypothetical protein
MNEFSIYIERAKGSVYDVRISVVVDNADIAIKV